MHDIEALARAIATSFAEVPDVVAIAMGGSQARVSARADDRSDLDLYVFTSAALALDTRARIVATVGAGQGAQLDQRFWGLSDQWIDRGTGRHIDVNYFDVEWMQGEVLRVVERHEASLGYTTCFWRTVSQSVVLADPTRWLTDLKARVDIAYPEALARNIIALNHPVLRGIYTSYAAQLETAVARADVVSINHRLAGLMASYFDCLFAANRVLHPGEKRLVEFALATCRRLPARMAADVEALLHDAVVAPTAVSRRVHALLDELDATLEAAAVPVVNQVPDAG